MVTGRTAESVLEIGAMENVQNALVFHIVAIGSRLFDSELVIGSL